LPPAIFEFTTMGFDGAVLFGPPAYAALPTNGVIEAASRRA
jgi:hypothetical protein